MVAEVAAAGKTSAASAASLDHHPGPYVIVHKNLGVTSGVHRTSALTERLPAGTAINVVEVVLEDQKIRGRLEFPVGWITILDINSCHRGATPVVTDAGPPAAAAVEAPPPPLSAASSALAAAPLPPAGAAAAASSKAIPAAASSKAAASDRGAVRLLESKVRELLNAHRVVEEELAETLTACSDLEARWVDSTGVSDDALRTEDAARQEIALLRRAVKEKEAKLPELEEARLRLGTEKLQAEREFEELEAAFQKRLGIEISQKQQEILEEVHALRRSADADEQRVRDALGEKTQMEQRALAMGVELTRGASHDVMSEAHGSISRAFANLNVEHPCLRLCDEPTLKITMTMFKQPVFRRLFFLFSIVMWLFYFFRTALMVSTTHTSGASEIG